MHRGLPLLVRWVVSVLLELLGRRLLVGAPAPFLSSGGGFSGVCSVPNSVRTTPPTIRATSAGRTSAVGTYVSFTDGRPRPCSWALKAAWSRLALRGREYHVAVLMAAEPRQRHAACSRLVT